MVKGNAKAGAIATFAATLLGIHEIPSGSNDGPGVRTIQSATGAYRAPWCVSTVQFIRKHVLGHVIANGTASAYYLADYAAAHGWTIPKPIRGAGVVYHIGAGHAGTVEKVYADGSFDAIEGNEGNAVNRVRRNPRQIRCTFFLEPELRAGKPKKPKAPPAPVHHAAVSGSLELEGPQGGAIVKHATSARIVSILPNLVKRFGSVTVTKGK